jgi:hypothetical protein
MPIPVAIDLLAEELEGLPDGGKLYLHRETGEHLLVLDHDLGIIEDGRENEEEFEWPWEGNGLQKLIEIVTTDQWIRLPTKFDIHEWRIMQRFALHVPEPLSSSLDRAIHRSGAFRAFKSVLHRAGEADAWYEFKHNYLVRMLSDVLESENIPFKRGRG